MSASWRKRISVTIAPSPAFYRGQGLPLAKISGTTWKDLKASTRHCPEQLFDCFSRHARLGLPTSQRFRPSASPPADARCCALKDHQIDCFVFLGTNNSDAAWQETVPIARLILATIRPITSTGFLAVNSPFLRRIGRPARRMRATIDADQSLNQYSRQVHRDCD